jgi:hypothetical protein
MRQGPATRPGSSPGRPFAGSRFRAGGFAYPLGFFSDYGDYDYPYYPPAPPPSVVVVPQPAPYVVEAPPVEAHSELREYKPPAAAELAPVEPQEQPAFAIALRDGSVQSAVLVSGQGDKLRYVDPDGRHHEVPLESVDREATGRLNRARKLQLQLPSPAAK